LRVAETIAGELMPIHCCLTSLGGTTKPWRCFAATAAPGGIHGLAAGHEGANGFG
jgi:hypothetical protein